MVTASEQITEQELKNTTGDRVRPEHIDSIIRNIEYHTFPGTLLTVCTIQLRNGFVVTGQCACTHPANFNREFAEKLSYERARGKIWLLEGYLLKERLYQATVDHSDETIARIAHNINMAYSAAIGDGMPQVPWERCNEATRKGVIYGVSLVRQNPNVSHEFLHESWMRDKLANGWTYGTSKNESKKTHPNLVPFKELPKYQQAKDAMFHATVKSLMEILLPQQGTTHG